MDKWDRMQLSVQITKQKSPSASQSFNETGGFDHPKGNFSSALSLDNLDVHGLVSELITKYNSRNDQGIIVNFFKRINVDSQTKHLQSVLDLVSQVRQHSSDLLEFKARLMSQREVLGNMIMHQIEESQFAIDRQREEYGTFLVKQEVERQCAHEELVRIKLQNDRQRLENTRVTAEVRLVELRGALIEKVTQELDLKNISPPQAFVLIKSLNPNSKETDIFMAQEQLDQMKAEAEIKRAEARKAGYAADYEEYKMKESMKPSDV